jgi:hypothetical protein
MQFNKKENNMKKLTKNKDINYYLNQWNVATQNIARIFIEKYFPEQSFSDTYWVAGDIGSILCISDMFFDLNHMIEALKLNATDEQLFEFYDAELEHGLKNTGEPLHTNFKNFVKYGWIGKKI